MIGGQIWGNETDACQIIKLRRVDGTNYVGGFVGNAKPGSVASVNTTAGEDLLSKLLNSLIKAPADMIKVLDATVATIRYADVSSWDDWGIIVNGAYDNGTNNTAYATAAGGFAGSLSGTVLGKKDTKSLRTGQVIDDCEDVGVVHEIVDAARFSGRMAEGDDVVVIDVGHGPDGPHLISPLTKAAATLLPGSRGRAVLSLLAEAVSTGMKL
mgnify:CR=1 FL=1